VRSPSARRRPFNHSDDWQKAQVARVPRAKSTGAPQLGQSRSSTIMVILANREGQFN
jgi:hypothetical protein